MQAMAGITEEAVNTEPQVMKVIGAGMGRTGTLSLKTALTDLGLKPYHMMNVFETTGHFELWRDFMRGDTAVTDVINRLSNDGFNATTDMPACFIHEDLLRQYPHAKVVLGVRQSGE